MTESSRKSLAQSLADWVHERRAAHHGVLELETLAGPELDSIARDIGTSPAELHEIVAQGPHAADLLPPRMAFAGLDPAAASRADPATFHDLQRLCSICQSKSECAHDLAFQATAEFLPDYCVNRDTLKALGAREH